MEIERKWIRAGIWAAAFGILLRLVSSGVMGAIMENPQVASLMILMETGRMVQLPQTTVATAPQVTEPTPTVSVQTPTQPSSTEVPRLPDKAVFGQDDADLVEVNSVCGYEADVPTLLQMPLSWDLTQGGPAVLILHTHGTESYTKTEDYTESSQYRTRDTGYNVVSIGEHIAKTLEAGGVQVLHDKTLHDHPSYNSSYAEARESIQQYMEQYPSIRMVLDIHRDSVELADGSQAVYTVELAEQTAAQLMMVVGTDANGLEHPNWQKNMALAVKLHAQLEKAVPGICRPISFRKQRFNQDLSAGAMLIEVGSAGNTRQQALLAAEQLAKGILALARGTAGELS